MSETKKKKQELPVNKATVKTAEEETPEKETPAAEVPEAEAPIEKEGEGEGASALEEALEEAIDYAALAISDLAEIKALCHEFASAEKLGDLPFAHRFAELRDLGLSVKEALAAAMPERVYESGKSHLRSAVPRPSYVPEESLSHEEMRAAKDLFYGMSEKEINALYRRVKKS